MVHPIKGKNTRRLHTGTFYQTDIATKVCTKCQLEKSKTEFTVGRKPSNNGLHFHEYYASRCKSCVNACRLERGYAKRHYQKNKGKLAGQRQTRRRQGGVSYFIRQRLASYRSRAKKKGFVCDLTPEYLLELWEAQAGRCHYTGLEMNMISSNSPTDLSASLDRLDPSLSYTKGNVIWCCNAVNIMKQRMSAQQLRCWAKAVVDHIPDFQDHYPPEANYWDLLCSPERMDSKGVHYPRAAQPKLP